ncbi:helix-turn-helix transcriptional regulator [Rummeliibacillus sp. POC4]|uniref:helix-turn-helix domain-containing protein n=1 Tax=Rummeliibacillus sp. POC4 TaxID=2305899 RepID=UPI000E66A4E4|nr:helix-turn-helix transcriptional regulator [Rummeliibacillus sp. POC4]RIJ65314.1 XRE family transcriptional regulator [Rummeliibacillus sp. POC4]
MNEIEFTEKEKLIMLRKRKRISQGQVACHLGVTQAYVSIFETGKYEFNDKLYTHYKNYIENY